MKITKISTVKELEEWFNSNNYEHLALDCETTSLKYMELELESIQLYNGANACYIEPHLIHEMQRFINRTKVLIGHNLVFDLKVLHKYGISYEHIEFFDTMVAEHLLDENNHNIGLKDLAKVKLGQEEVLTWVQARAYGKESKEWLTYCINDVLWTWDLMIIQKPQLEEQGLIDLFRTIEMPFLLCLLDMEINGFLIDKDKVITTTTQLVQEKENLEVQMLQELGKDYDIQMKLDGSSIITSGINFNSSQQLSEIIFTEIGLPVVEETPGGKPSVGKLTISKYMDNPFIKLLNKYKICSKLLSGFFIPMPDFIDSDGRIRPSFNDCGTVTGRLSCIAEGTKIQIVRDFSKEPESKNIEDIKQGDYVYCSNEEGDLKVRRVKRLINNGKRECIKLKWNSLSNKFGGDLILTPEHKVKTLEDKWVRADSIPFFNKSLNGELMRRGINFIGQLDSRVYALHYEETNHYIIGREDAGTHQVYDLEIGCMPGEDTHNFFANEICVHNCSKPNLQQLPAKNKYFPVSTRECFIAPLGKEIVTCDYKGQELRVIGELSRDPTLIKFINEGKDLHLTTANDMFNLGIEEKDLYETSVGYEAIEEKFHTERGNAKSIIFGLCYGKGAWKFSQDFGIPEAEAQVMIDKFFNQYPMLKEEISKTHNQLKSEGYVTTSVGRKRRFKKEKRVDAQGNEYWCYPAKAYRMSFNFLIQGLSADMMRKAAVIVRQNVLLHPEWEVKHIATVHDEHVYECNELHVPDFSECLVESFKNAMKLTVELKSDIGVGGSYESAK